MLTKPIQVLKQTELLGHQFTVYGTAENPLFLTKEIADIIEYSASNSSKLTNLVDKDEKVRNIITTPGGNQEVWLLTEDGLYEVLFQSRKPIAKQFKKGVKQILHEVRTTGGYISTTPNDTPEEIMARALTIAQATLAKREERLKQLEAQTEQQQATIEIQTEEIKKSRTESQLLRQPLAECEYADQHPSGQADRNGCGEATQKAERNRNHLPTKRAVDITCALFDMGDALNPYTDVHTLGRFDRNKCIYGMDYQRCAFHYCSI